jgi:tetratricopeptide (TPR) repeat protein
LPPYTQLRANMKKQSGFSCRCGPVLSGMRISVWESWPVCIESRAGTTKQKQYDEAETLFDEALKGRQRELGDDHPDTLETQNDLAVVYKEQGNYDKAEQLLLKAVEGRRLKLGDTHPRTLESCNNLIALYEAWGKPDKASEWRAKLPEVENTGE